MNYKIYKPDDFPCDVLNRCDTVYNKHDIEYFNIGAAFDIETTTIRGDNPFAFMYIWQFAVKSYDDTILVTYGRTWEEWEQFFFDLSRALDLSDKKRLVIYVHNLYYEWQFMHNFGKFSEVFARKPRHVLKCFWNYGFEFRCSYILSNKKLSKFCEECDTEHGKLEGYLDYTVIRTPRTVLRANEFLYAIYDVVGLVECIQARLEHDTIATIPLTSTGYVRREFRNSMQENPVNREYFLKTRLTPLQYTMCKEAFRGGDTHANAYFVNEILDNVQSYDKKSSYPAQMATKMFPGKFFYADPENFKHDINNPNLAMLFRARFAEIEVKTPYGMPYISLDKCTLFDKEDIVIDNGRILYARAIEITLTDIDFRIIKEGYKWKQFGVKNVFISRYQRLPIEFIKPLIHYFCQKESLPKDSYEYAKSKNIINGAYGMIVTDIASDDIIWTGSEWLPEKRDLEKALNKYYQSYNSFLPYQWGVWVTAHARKALRDGMDCYMEKFYTDTDSVKGFVDEEKMRKLNDSIIAEALSAPIPAIADVNGKRSIMGVWENEGIYEHFITLGAKRYAYYTKGEWHTTIAGVNKQKGKKFVNEHGIESFKIGTMIVDSGKLEAKYNDTTEIYKISVNGDEFTTSSNMVLLPKPFTLGISESYRAVLENVELEKFGIDKIDDSML